MARIDDHQGPGATAEMPALPSGGERPGPADASALTRPDLGAPRAGVPRQDTGGFPAPGADTGQHTDPFVRSDVFGPAAPDSRRAPAQRPAADPFGAEQSYDAGRAAHRLGGVFGADGVDAVGA
ncbi:hypothetical protein, partial [Streptomyces mexicanus]|uniref:hypothetical protein n=1 Tax=Streptomyces mexicanus TaxID=178566 RepID=UPI0031E80853